MMGYGACKKGLSCPWRTVEKNTLGLCYTNTFEKFGMVNGKFDNLLDFTFEKKKKYLNVKC